MITGLIICSSGDVRRSGNTSVFLTSYRVGSALGLAAITALATSCGADTLGDLPDLSGGFSAAFTGAAVIAAAGAVLAAITLRGARATSDPSQPATTTA